MNPMNKVLLRCAAVAAVVLCGPAYAQDAPADETAAEPASEAPVETTAEPASETPVREQISNETATQAEQTLEEDLALLWGSRREIKVVQKRLVEKDGRFELMPYASIVPNDDFIVYYPLGLRLGYHFSEAFAVEGSFAYALDVDTGLAEFLETGGPGLRRAAIQEQISMFYNVNILWAPLYGKLSLLGYKLTHFETYVGLGFGMFHTTEYPADDPEGNPKVKPSGNTVLGFRWFITDHFNIRTEYRQYFFQKYNGGVSIPAELSLGLGITI